MGKSPFTPGKGEWFLRFISTRTHGILDYLMGVLLIVAPWLFGFAAGDAETWVPVLLGIAVIACGLMTDCERGAAPPF